MPCDSAATFYEFFAGGGLARLGLEPAFRCVFANDFDPQKARAYSAAFGADHFHEGDVGALSADDLPGRATLAWASFPCQDLSLAGGRAGFDGERSGAFWGFWKVIKELDDSGRAPELLALENVCGLLTSRGGSDFNALIEALRQRGYRAGALEIDAALFTPQSRPRLFVIATRAAPPSDLIQKEPSAPFHSTALINAVARLPESARADWIWWRLPVPPARNTSLADILDDECEWDSPEKTRRFLAQMNPLHRARVQGMKHSGRQVGALFRRIRVEDGKRIQRAEARFDGLAGCLRTPAGGSSRQTLLVVEGANINTRLISPREGARLMGLPDDYPLPSSQTAALQLVGDGVCVSVVRWLSDHLLAPLAGQRATQAAA